MGVARVADLPAEWSRQHQLLGLPVQVNTQSNRASLRTKVSVAGKRNFAGRDKGAETAPEDQGDHCRDMTHASNPANSEGRSPAGLRRSDAPSPCEAC